MKALILYGGWEGHQPKVFTRHIAGWLRELDYEVQADNHLDKLDNPHELKNYDLIVPVWSMGEISEIRGQNLAQAVESGVGLAGMHGMADAFRNCLPYHLLVGGQFVVHPPGYLWYTVEITDPSDPLVSGITPFEVHTEQYYLQTDPANHVLLHTNLGGSEHPLIDVQGIKMPVCWKRNYGNGRVFYLSLGHSPEELENPTLVKLMKRGLQWATRI